MSASKTFILSTLLAFAEARFGQEQIPVPAIAALSNFGSPGEAATLAGAVPGVLLASANPCAKLQLADKIVSSLGNDSQVISAAAGLVGAERNFNPFVVSIDSFCASADLPATEALRGIVPLVDPSVVGSDVENANAKSSLTKPFDATGLSVAQVAIAHGFSNFTAVDSDGTKVNLSGDAADAGSSADSGSGTATATASVAAAAADSSATASTTSVRKGSGSCGFVTVTRAAAASTSATSASTEAAAATDAASSGNSTSTGAADFGLCDPTIKRAGGLGGRPATEFTFQSNDPKIAAIQQEALNPNIITNRICDELTNQCKANAAAKSLCLAAKAKVAAIGSPADRGQNTVTVFNSALGF
ncbi:hypothetical protein TD95_001114 [Thielaviopsis punctulata]|uniref:Uncharacterized protein n=1 Tax=Thielaviopsis punctulata TaxID=72032 RepID=A0A0F4ZJ42_9PEZI|nr:hypothetical protein TD95_001114 [Thielaviopsis punctulata]